MDTQPATRAGLSAYRTSTVMVLSALVVAAITAVPTARAAASGAEDLRRDLTGFARVLARGAGSDTATSDLGARVATLESADLEALSQALADQPGWPATRDIVRSFDASAPDGARSPVTEPEPGSDRCPSPLSTTAILNLIVVRSSFEGAAAALHAACDVTIAGFNPSPLCIAGGVADIVVVGIVAVVDTDAACADEGDSLAHDAAIETQEGMAMQLDDIESKLDASAGAALRSAERQLEEQVRTCRPLVSLALPEEFGGELGNVRRLVEKWLKQCQLAGVGDIPAATRWLRRGDDANAVRDYAAAYRSFCQAYRLLLPR